MIELTQQDFIAILKEKGFNMWQIRFLIKIFDVKK